MFNFFNFFWIKMLCSVLIPTETFLIIFLIIWYLFIRKNPEPIIQYVHMENSVPLTYSELQLKESNSANSVENEGKINSNIQEEKINKIENNILPEINNIKPRKHNAPIQG